MDAPPVQYVTTSDGYSIAYAVSGSGTPVVFMPSQFTHIETYWSQETFLLPWLRGLAARFRLVQYDGRGQGMSQRGLPQRIAIADLANDLNAVVEKLRLGPFCLMASQWSVHAGVHYAVEHPGRVSALVLAASTVKGSELPMVIAEDAASRDWDGFLLSQLPVGRATDVRAALARMKGAVTQEDWSKLIRASACSDLSGLLPRLATPTLILHPRDLFRLESSMKLAQATTHGLMVHVEGTPPFGDAEHGLALIDDFLASLTPPHQKKAVGPVSLSPRQDEVLRRLAEGKTTR